MVDSIAHRIARRRLSQLMMRPAVTLIELLCAVVVFGVLAGGGYGVYDSYMRAQRANQVAELLRWEVTVARSYAIRSGRPMTLVIDEVSRSVSLHDGAVVRRMVSLGDGARLRVERLSIEIPGDSLVFSARGLCLNCRSTGSTDLSIEAEGRVATVRVELLGRPAVSTQERAGGA
jgi:prepilin-type N-terminal cleavage/methylation domain-containing protein